MNNLKSIKSVKIKLKKVKWLEYMKNNIHKTIFISIIWITVATIFNFLSLVGFLSFMTGIFIWEFIMFRILKPKKEVVTI